MDVAADDAFDLLRSSVLSLGAVEALRQAPAAAALQQALEMNTLLAGIKRPDRPRWSVRI